jgi:hypothetical protein
VKGTGALSQYVEPTDGERKWGYDWLADTVFGGRRRHLDVSYEVASPHYRSIGSPLRYQDRHIFRVAPTFQIVKWWSVLGEYRIEQSGVLVSQGLSPYTNTYTNLANLFTFTSNSARLSGTEFSSSLYGRRTNGNLDLTHYLGRSSVGMGGSVEGQWDTTDRMSERIHTGRANFEVVRGTLHYSMGEEYSRTYYNLFNILRFTSTSSLSLNAGDFRSLFQYKVEPKFFLFDDKLYTGAARIGFATGNKKAFSLIYSASSLHSDLSHPEVWRIGFEYSLDLY